MYQDLKQQFWWEGMKKDVAKYVNKCYVCRVVKAIHQKPPRELQLQPFPEWKWPDLSKDFMVGVSRTSTGNNYICLVVD